MPVAGSEATAVLEPVEGPAGGPDVVDGGGAPAAPDRSVSQVGAGGTSRREASDEQKARREAKVADLMDGLSEELAGGRPDSRRAEAIVRSLQRHLAGMCRHIAERLVAVGNLEESEAAELAHVVAHFGSDIAPSAWADVARSRVDRIAERALSIGQLIDQTLPDA
jgi:hypothetical protein